MRREEGSFSSVSNSDSDPSSEEESFSSVSSFDYEETSGDGSGMWNSSTSQVDLDAEHYTVKRVACTSISRSEATAVALKDGRILVMGGCRGLDVLKSGEVYESEGRWKPMKKSMLTKRAGFAAVRIGNNVFAMGGWRNLHSMSSSVDVLDTETWVWKKSNSLRKARSNFAAAAVGRCIYVFGGKDGSSCHFLVDCERYDVDTGKTYKLPDLPTTKNSHACAAVAVGTKIYVLCNEDSYRQCSGCVWEFDTTSCTWTSRNIEPMPVPRTDFAAVSVWGRHVIVIGGAYGSLASTVDALDTVTGKWTTLTAEEDQSKQSNHWAVTLCDNSILVSGEWGASSRGAQQLFLSHLLTAGEAPSNSASSDGTISITESCSEESSEILVEDASADSFDGLNDGLDISSSGGISEKISVHESSSKTQAQWEALGGLPVNEQRKTVEELAHRGNSSSTRVSNPKPVSSAMFDRSTQGVATIASPRVATIAERLRLIEQRFGNTGQTSESIVGRLVAFEQHWTGSVQQGSVVSRLDRLERVVGQQATVYEERLEQLKIKSNNVLNSVGNLEELLFGHVQDGPLKERVGRLENIL